MSFEQTFKNIDDPLYKDSGADSESDDIGQTSWVMLLHYLGELEQDKADEAELRGENYSFILDKESRWPNGQCQKVQMVNSILTNIKSPIDYL